MVKTIVFLSRPDIILAIWLGVFAYSLGYFAGLL
jgi:hypothetical protein